MAAKPNDITQLLLKWSKGSSAALEDLVPLIYPELRRLARKYMRQENPGHTLQTSALINEAYLRLAGTEAAQWQNRSHFFAVAAQVMRRILIDHARKHQVVRRGGGLLRVSLDETAFASHERASEFVALDEALTKLALVDARKSQIVEMKFFGGLTVEEVAEVMKLSPITIKREWRAAKAWLRLEITEHGLSESS